MASGTAGNLITYDSSGDPAAVSTGTSGQVLRFIPLGRLVKLNAVPDVVA